MFGFRVFENSAEIILLPMTAGFAGIPGPSATFFGPKFLSSLPHFCVLFEMGTGTSW
jgi:hypothetical protein